jgi:hypothetical protein
MIVGYVALFFGFEFVLAGAADGAYPIFREVFPFGAGFDAVIGISLGLVINVSADSANIFFHRVSSVAFSVSAVRITGLSPVYYSLFQPLLPFFYSEFTAIV